MTNQPAPSDTPTPRTDAELVVIDCIVHGQPDQRTVILPKFCRQLERELTRLSAEREKVQQSANIWEQAATDAQTIIEHKTACIAKLEEEAEVMKEMIYNRSAEIDRLSAEREKEIPAFPQTTEDPVAVALIARLTATIAERDRQLAEARDSETAFRIRCDNLSLELAASQRQKAELEAALSAALIPLAVLKLSEEYKPYLELSPDLKQSILKGHDAAYGALLSLRQSTQTEEKK